MLLEGSKIGPYRIEEPVGRGAFAVVYRAHDPRLDDHVAVKVLADNLAVDPEMSVRFIGEARALRAVRSESVATVFDVGTTPTGQPYIVQEFAERGSLRLRLAERLGVAVADLRRLIDALEEAMTALHDAGIVHRDIKPDNVLIRGGAATGSDGVLFEADDELVLTDFGIAKNLRDASGLTVGAGTMAYAAPEQLEAFSHVDRRADLFAASALIAETIVGPGDMARAWEARLRDQLGDGPLTTALAAALSEDREHRPADAEEWAASLRRALDDDTVLGPAPTRRVGRRAAVALAAIAVAVGAMLAALAALRQDESSSIGNEALAATSDVAEPVRTSTTTEAVGENAPSFGELAGTVGTDEELWLSNNWPLQPIDKGWATFRCHLAFMGSDVQPPGLGEIGQPAHLTFFGNSSVVDSSTPTEIAAAGPSTCAGGGINRSSLWTTTIYDPATGEAVPVAEMRVSYTVGQLTEAEVDALAAFPSAFATTLGNPLATDASETPGTIRWDCADDGSDRSEVYIWDCPESSNIFATFRFAQCWDGTLDFEGAAELRSARPGAGCPDSHPLPLPTVRFRLYYDLSGIDDSSRLRASTDPLTADVGGLTVAGGFVHGWQTEAFQSVVDGCLIARVDCSFNIVGADRALAMPPGG